MLAGGGSPRYDGGSGRFNGTGGAAGNPAQASLLLLQPTSDAAMTYFYGQLFAMDTEIRAMFPAAMDVQRKRFFRALVRIVQDQGDAAVLVPYLEQLGRAHRKFGVRERHYGVFRRALLATLHSVRRAGLGRGDAAGLGTRVRPRRGRHDRRRRT